MSKYRLRKIYYLNSIFSITISMIGINVLNNPFSNIILALCIIASLILAINSAMTYIGVNADVIVSKNLMRKTIIHIDEIEAIKKMPTSKHNKPMIGIYGADKKIFVSFWYDNQKELVEYLISESEKQNRAKVDIEILSLFAS